MRCLARRGRREFIARMTNDFTWCINLFDTNSMDTFGNFLNVNFPFRILLLEKKTAVFSSKGSKNGKEWLKLYFQLSFV